MSNAHGFAYCQYCGAEYRLFTIFNRDMQGLCKAWKQRHERRCATRTPAERRKWAKPYVGKDRVDSSIVVDMAHPGFGQPEPALEFDLWFENLAELVLAKTGIAFRDPDAVRDDYESGADFERVAQSIIIEYTA